MKLSKFESCLRYSGLFIIPSVLLFTAGCATKVSVNMLQPAEFHQASLTKTVAVLPFSGPGGPEFALELEGLLTGIDLNGKPYFTMVDRASIDKVVSEMKLSESGLVDPKSAVKLGKIIGAQGIYTGAITANGARDGKYTEERTECARYQMEKDKDGNLRKGACISWRKYSVNCVKRTASFSVTPKLIDVATARILYSANRTGSAESSGCEDRTPPKGRQELLDKSRETAKQKIRQDVAPFYVTVAVRLKSSDDGIESKQAKEMLGSGIEWAANKRMDKACEIWGTARQLAPGSPSINYNLGVCAESVADGENALKLYTAAENLIGKPDDDVSAAIVRVRQTLGNQKKLKEQMTTN